MYVSDRGVLAGGMIRLADDCTGARAGGCSVKKKRSATVVADAGNITAVSDGRQDRASPLLRV